MILEFKQRLILLVKRFDTVEKLEQLLWCYWSQLCVLEFACEMFPDPAYYAVYKKH